MIQPVKSSPPLKNPPFRKPAEVEEPSSKNIYPGTTATTAGGKGGSRGKGGLPPVCFAGLLCLHCGKCQQISFYYGRPPAMHTCLGCAQRWPIAGYHCYYYGNLPLERPE